MTPFDSLKPGLAPAFIADIFTADLLLPGAVTNYLWQLQICDKELFLFRYVMLYTALSLLKSQWSIFSFRNMTYFWVLWDLIDLLSIDASAGRENGQMLTYKYSKNTSEMNW